LISLVHARQLHIGAALILAVVVGWFVMEAKAAHRDTQS